jgi:hypothetical protein
MLKNKLNDTLTTQKTYGMVEDELKIAVVPNLPRDCSPAELQSIKIRG